ncbi:MAG: hypothetical protein ACREFY_08075, partial [Acetobacteraceae bacterium]
LIHEEWVNSGRYDFRLARGRPLCSLGNPARDTNQSKYRKSRYFARLISNDSAVGTRVVTRTPNLPAARAATTATLRADSRNPMNSGYTTSGRNRTLRRLCQVPRRRRAPGKPRPGYNGWLQTIEDLP